jgi:16S rRNA (cytidine1402-2'-O)-methyltransferase
VTALPGASAVLTALTVSGLPSDSFHFAGFLPPRSGARRNRLEAMRAIPATLILFEAPTRVADTLADIAAVLPDRTVCLARELTKLHETVRRGSPLAVAAGFDADGARGECVILIAPPDRHVALDDDAIVAELAPLLAQGPLSAAVRSVAASLDVPRSRVYDLALALKKDPS